MTQIAFCGVIERRDNHGENVIEDLIASSSHVYRARVDTSGRIVLPNPLRRQLHLSPGDEVLVVQTGDSFRIETPDQALRAAQEYFCSLVPAGVSLVDELLAERRADVEREREGNA